MKHILILTLLLSTSSAFAVNMDLKCETNGAYDLSISTRDQVDGDSSDMMVTLVTGDEKRTELTAKNISHKLMEIRNDSIILTKEHSSEPGPGAYSDAALLVMAKYADAPGYKVTFAYNSIVYVATCTKQ